MVVGSNRSRVVDGAARLLGNIVLPGQVGDGLGAASEGTLPNVLLIGSMKSGTTTLASALYDYGVCPASVDNDSTDLQSTAKEVHYFDRVVTYRQKGDAYYKKRFAAPCPSGMRMDATPRYLGAFWSEGSNKCINAMRANKTYAAAGLKDNVKIIAMLREPVSRIVSEYNHALEACTKHKIGWACKDVYVKSKGTPKIGNFTRWLAKKGLEFRKGLERGMYYSHIVCWKRYFKPEQILLLSFDELKHHPEKFLLRVFKFLGMDVHIRGDTKQRLHDDLATSLEAKNQKWIGEGVELHVDTLRCRMHRYLTKKFQIFNEKLYLAINGKTDAATLSVKQKIKRWGRPSVQQNPFPHFVSKKCKPD